MIEKESAVSRVADLLARVDLWTLPTTSIARKAVHSIYGEIIDIVRDLEAKKP